MWRRPLNSTFNYYCPQKTRKVCSTGYILEYKVGWWTSGRRKWIEENYIMGKTSIRKGLKKYKEEGLGKIHCSTRKNILSEIVNSSKTYSSDLSLTFDYMFYPPRTGSEPQLTVIKPITSPVLSSTLLQIYCIGLIGPISYSIWVWATNWDPTVCMCVCMCVCVCVYINKYKSLS